MKRYGFLVVSRKNHWGVTFPDDSPAGAFATKGEAEAAISEWQAKVGKIQGRRFEEAQAESAQAREKFIAETKFELVTVHNPLPFQPDSQKPTVTFPDGSTVQFDEGTPEERIKAQIEATACEEHPDPAPGGARLGVATPAIEESPAWDAELFLGDERRRLPDIETWSYFFPMESVAATLNDLAEEGWSVVHVSEDRGLYSAEIVSNMSAPVIARYLLVHE